MNKENLLLQINIDKLLSTRLELGTFESFDIIDVKPKFENDGWCLYLTMFNNQDYLTQHSFAKCQHICSKLQDLQHVYKYDSCVTKQNIKDYEQYRKNIQKIKDSKLPVIIIRISNPLLRDASYEDFIKKDPNAKNYIKKVHLYFEFYIKLHII